MTQLMPSTCSREMTRNERKEGMDSSCLQQMTPEALITCPNISQHSSDLDTARFLPSSTFTIIVCFLRQ